MAVAVGMGAAAARAAGAAVAAAGAARAGSSPNHRAGRASPFSFSPLYITLAVYKLLAAAYLLASSKPSNQSDALPAPRSGPAKKLICVIHNTHHQRVYFSRAHPPREATSINEILAPSCEREQKATKKVPGLAQSTKGPVCAVWGTFVIVSLCCGCI